MTFQIPNKNRQFIQTNNSDVEGNLYSTFNCDFDNNQGVLQLARKMFLNISTADIANILGAPVGFRYFNNGSSLSLYTAAGASNAGSVYSSLVANAAFAKVLTSGAPATIDSSTSDIETAFGELYVSSASEAKVYYLNGSNAWSSFTAGAAGSTMMLCYFPAAQRVYVTKGGNIIQSFDSGHSVTSPSNPNALQLGTGENITFIRAGSNVLWIGTVNINGGNAFIYQWDGAATQVQKTFKLESSGALSCVIKNDSPHVIDSNGSYLIWNGGTFVRQTGFNRKNNKSLYGSAANLNNRFIHPNGMAIIDNEVHALVDLTNQDASAHTGTQEDCNPSGIWAYQQLSGNSGQLRHKYSVTLGKSTDTVKDYGQFKIRSAGGLMQLINTSNIANGTILAGVGYFSDATSILYGIFYEDTADTSAKIGYLVSSIISSANITQMWGKIIAFHDKFASATDRIIAKVRHIFNTPTEATITWITTTSFSASGTDLSAYKTGHEVDILQGIGAGQTSHIVTIQQASGSNVFIISVDETYTGASGTAIARFTKWKRIGIIKDTDDFGEAPIENAASRVQIKIIGSWTGKNQISRVVETDALQKSEI